MTLPSPTQSAMQWQPGSPDLVPGNLLPPALIVAQLLLASQERKISPPPGFETSVSPEGLLKEVPDSSPLDGSPQEASPIAPMTEMRTPADGFSPTRVRGPPQDAAPPIASAGPPADAGRKQEIDLPADTAPWPTADQSGDDPGKAVTDPIRDDPGEGSARPQTGDGPDEQPASDGLEADEQPTQGDPGHDEESQRDGGLCVPD